MYIIKATFLCKTCVRKPFYESEVVSRKETLAEAISWVWKEYQVKDCEIVDKDFMQVVVETRELCIPYSLSIEREDW